MYLHVDYEIIQDDDLAHIRVSHIRVYMVIIFNDLQWQIKRFIVNNDFVLTSGRQYWTVYILGSPFRQLHRR